MKPNPSNRIRTLLIAAMLAAAPAIWAASPSPTPSASVSELLEQGIYNEDTKGDIDAAISIYQQLIVQASANDSLAAQAEFRLGQCYLKENRKDDATAAFQKLVKDFPNETELVAKAKEYLPGAMKLEPVPWVDGERLQLKLYTATGTELGIVEYRSDLVESGTQSIWRVGARLDAGGAGSVSSVDAEAETFRPISSRWKHSLLGEVEAVYHPGKSI
jgi:tetratricopeptide (TPR) repeat protein